MAANAEVIISPEVSRQDLNKSMKRISKALKKTANQASDYFTKAMKKSGEDAGKKFSKAFKSKLGLAGIATAIAGAVFSGLNVARDQVARTDAAIVGLLGERDASTNIAFASGQGLTNEEISAFNSRVTRSGGDDQMGRDFIVDTSEYIAQARAGENDLLANFANFKGLDQFNAVIASLAGRDADDINKFLADIGWAGDSGVIFNMLEELGGRTGNEAFKYLKQITEADRQNAINLQREADLEKKFSEITRRVNINVKSGLLENLGTAELEQFQKGLELQAQAEIDAVKNYEKNQNVVLEMERTQQSLDLLMLEFFRWVLQIKEPIEASFKFLSSLISRKEKTPEEQEAEVIKMNQIFGESSKEIGVKDNPNQTDWWGGYKNK